MELSLVPLIRKYLPDFLLDLKLEIYIGLGVPDLFLNRQIHGDCSSYRECNLKHFYDIYRCAILCIELSYYYYRRLCMVKNIIIFFLVPLPFENLMNGPVCMTVIGTTICDFWCNVLEMATILGEWLCPFTHILPQCTNATTFSTY